jgi:hypothetical protein
LKDYQAIGHFFQSAVTCLPNRKCTVGLFSNRILLFTV